MLVVTVDLVPGGYEVHRRTIGSLRIANVSNLADVSDYSINVTEGANPVTGDPPRRTACLVLAHDRRQRVWALLEKASAEIMKADFVEL